MFGAIFEEFLKTNFVFQKMSSREKSHPVNKLMSVFLFFDKEITSQNGQSFVDPRDQLLVPLKNFGYVWPSIKDR